MLMVRNKGKEIVETDYWKTTQNQHGSFYCSINAGAFRLLVDTTTSSEAHSTIDAARIATEIVVSRGCWDDDNNKSCIEFLFLAASQVPFVLFFYPDQIDAMPADEDAGREFGILIYDRAEKVFDGKCKYRRVHHIPCYEPFAVTGGHEENGLPV